MASTERPEEVAGGGGAAPLPPPPPPPPTCDEVGSRSGDRAVQAAAVVSHPHPGHLAQAQPHPQTETQSLETGTTKNADPAVITIARDGHDSHDDRPTMPSPGDADTTTTAAPAPAPETSSSSSSHIHMHRLNHSPSKLPAFRFADRSSCSWVGGVLGSLQNHHSLQVPIQAVSHHPPDPSGFPAGGSKPTPPANPGPLLVGTAAHHLPQNTTSTLENSTGCSSSSSSQDPPAASASASPSPSPSPSPSLPSAGGASDTARTATTIAATAAATATTTATPSATTPAPIFPLPLPPTPTTQSLLIPAPVTESDNQRQDTAHAPRSADSLRSPPSTTSPDQKSLQRSRASTYETASASAPVTPNAADRKRPAPSRIDGTTTAAAAAATTTSTPAGPDDDDSSSAPPTPQSQADTESSPCFYTPITRPRTRRRDSSRDSCCAPSPLTSRGQKEDVPTPGSSTKEWTQGHRGLILPKGLGGTVTDEINEVPRRRRSSTSRPPISNRRSASTPCSATTPGRIPPLRTLRSSSRSRKSSAPDMSKPSYRYYDDGDDYQQGANHRDRSLRALEGRVGNDWSRDDAPPDAEDETPESENNTADIFMRIAREDSSTSLPRPKPNNGRPEEEPSGTVSRVVRRQRPNSGYYGGSPAAAQRPATPPSVSRHVPDQQVPSSSRTRRAPGDQLEQNTGRDASYQSSATGRPALKLDAATRAPTRMPALKPSPITPRTQSVLDNASDRSSIFARRPSTKAGEHSRSSSIRQPTGLSKSFTSSSTMTLRNGEPSHQVGGGQLPEASESSNSTAAPSTVWDELDELKSRIHRLELTGKIPKTSGAAISRISDERPPTSGTGATTLSGSPKRASGVGGSQTEIVSLSTSQKETQPLLRSALAKTKPFVSSDVYDAIEAAANDASSLSQLMGTAGQPGPISSGASTIGVGGSSTITDRQLRKKAESICRNLTELCVALTEEGSQRKTSSLSRPQTRGAAGTREDDTPSSPPAMKVFTGRRSAGPDEPLPSVEEFSSPRVTRLEKRATFNFTGMNGASSSVPSPRYAASVMGGEDGRKSSLVVSRARRGVTEEPDDQGRKTALLRTRRAVTAEAEDAEDPEETRRLSFAIAPRRVTTISRVSNIDEEPQPGSRAPSRAITEIGRGLRIAVPTRDSTPRRPVGQEPASATAAQPTRRLLTSALPTAGPPSSSRLMTPTTPSGRRFLQVSRQQQDRDDTSNITGRLAEARGQRYSLGAPSTASASQPTILHRKRHSGIPSISGTASNVGGYR